MYDKIFTPKAITLPNGKVVLQRRSRMPLIILILAVCTALSVRFTGFSLHTLVTRMDEFFTIIGQMIPPNWAYLPRIWGPLLDTIKMSLLGSMIGALLALPAAVAAASNIIQSKLVVVVSKTLLSLLRTLPTLVTALIATYVFGLGPMAGTIAIMLFTISYVGKLLYEQIENVDIGAFEAMESVGMTRIQAFRFAIFPQILPGYISTSLYCFEGNVRYAAILGFVGAGGIGLVINEGLGWRDYPAVGMIILVLIVTVYLIERVSEHFRKKLI
ncbi:phosphonate ABC transporter, permease protein PhnE [Paenibacillus sambharensis]|uniref:Phosphonate ABC transporter, permease protein PhnE n=1 Tax=Paenibacillus sambharensis TaxID=1803190 RepID=A0A2W1L7N9_9BACL|nr:phosphonate ABC transporter, permease protein PhnE [Paenibacillus sambharensis]PZD95276.1 phosphonate ABC transporter, permease protein PhnE [Paenibacillus sambharensis]